MFKLNPLAVAVMVATGTLSALPAVAQDANKESLDRVEITGSRLKAIVNEASSLVTVSYTHLTLPTIYSV